MIYWASTSGTSDADIQKRNLEFAAQELDRCSSRGESFVYVVPAEIIFDMKTPGVRHTEHSTVCPSCYAGQVCLTAENRVHEYEHGYILRIMPLIDSGHLHYLFDHMRHGAYNGEKTTETSFQFSSRQVVEEMAKSITNMTSKSLERPRIQHVCSPIRFTTSYIIFSLLGEDPGIELSSDSTAWRIFPDLPASFCTENADDRQVRHIMRWTHQIGERTLKDLRCPRVI